MDCLGGKHTLICPAPRAIWNNEIQDGRRVGKKVYWPFVRYIEGSLYRKRRYNEFAENNQNFRYTPVNNWFFYGVTLDYQSLLDLNHY